MSAELLFSFLLFFQVQIESIKESGFYKMLLEKYPELSENIENERELKEIFDFSGLNFDDLAQFSITVEASDAINNASKEGRSPKIGSEIDFFLSAKVKGELDSKKMFSFILKKIEEEKGEEFSEKVEKTINKNADSSSIIIPSDLLGKTVSELI